MTNVCFARHLPRCAPWSLVLIALCLWPTDCVRADTNAIFVYATYVGGSGKDYGCGVQSDDAGNLYLAGYTESTNYPTTNALKGAKSGFSDAAISKLNSPGRELVFSTYLGGNNSEACRAMTIDSSSNIYVTGYTDSADFPVTNGFRLATNGMRDLFVTKLQASGTALVWSVVIGGGADDYPDGIAVDAASNVYVTGYTFSEDFPTTNALQPAYGGTNDAFVLKIAASGSNLIYSTYLGGALSDQGHAIAADTDGSAWVAGQTCSSNTLPVTNAFQPNYGGGFSDGFVARLDPAGTQLLFSTYLGGSSSDGGVGIDLDTGGCVYVVGDTSSSDFPTTNACQPFYSGWNDGFLAKLPANGTGLVYSTFVGTDQADNGIAVTVDPAGRPCFLGRFYTKEPGWTSWVAVVRCYDAAATNIESTARFGGVGYGPNIDIYPTAIALDPFSNVYVSGYTMSNNFTTPQAFQPAYGGDLFDALAVKICSASNPVDIRLTKTDSGGLSVGSNFTYTITVANDGPSNATGVAVSDPLPGGPTFVSASCSQGSWTQEDGVVTCSLGAVPACSSATLAITVTPLASGILTNIATSTVNEPDHNPPNNRGLRVSLVPFDADADGIGDDWEWLNFHTLTNAADGDNDGDLWGNYREFIAGTQPTNAASLFGIATNAYAGTNFYITVRTAPGRRYAIYCADAGLSNGAPWLAFANTNNTVGTWVETAVVESAYTFVDDKTPDTTGGEPASGRRCYRVKVSVP